MTQAFLTVAAYLACFVAPGYFLTRRLLRDADLTERWVLAAGTGFFAVPALVFVVAWALASEFSSALVLGAAAGIVVACRPWRLPALGDEQRRKEGLLVLGALLAGAVVVLCLTEVRFGDTFGFFHPCLHELAGYLGDHDGNGWILFDPDTGRHVTHVIRHYSQPVLGVEYVINNQRLTNSSVVACAMVLSGRASLDLLSLHTFFVIAGGGYLMARRLLRSELARTAVGLLTLAGAHGLIAFMVNETAFAFAVGLLVLALLCRGSLGARELVLTGMLLGTALGSRMAALAWLLPVAVLLRQRPARTWVAPALAFVLSAAPWLVGRWWVTGSPFSHTGEDGANIEHTLLGLSFVFRPLNWPFLDSLMAPPNDVLPPMLLVPLAAIRSMGACLAAASLVGLAYLLRAHRTLAVVSLLWALPVSLFLLVQAYIDYEKTSWLLLGASVLPWSLAAFGAALAEKGPRLPALAGWLALAAILAFLPGWAAGVRLETDEREFVIVEPQIAPAPQAEEARREELGRVQLLPSFNEVKHRTTILESLADAGAEPFRSGQIVAWDALYDHKVYLPRTAYAKAPPGMMDGVEEFTFPIRTAEKTEELPDPFEAAAFSDLFKWQDIFAVDLRLPVGPVAEVRMHWREDGTVINVKPGPGPHLPRRVAFYVVYADEFPRVWVYSGGAAVPVRRQGYNVRMDSGRASYRDLRLVTNVAVRPPEATQRLVLGPQVWELEPLELARDASPELAAPAGRWLCATTGRPCSGTGWDHDLRHESER